MSLNLFKYMLFYFFLQFCIKCIHTVYKMIRYEYKHTLRIRAYLAKKYKINSRKQLRKLCKNRDPATLTVQQQQQQKNRLPGFLSVHIVPPQVGVGTILQKKGTKFLIFFYGVITTTTACLSLASLCVQYSTA